MEQWDSDGETVWWDSGTVGQWNSEGGIVWWNGDGGNVLVEQWNSDGGTVWCNSGTVIVEQCCGTVEQIK